MPCINGYRGGTASLTRQKCMHLFSSGRIQQYCTEVLLWGLTFMRYLQIFRCRLSTVCRDVITFCIKYIKLKHLQFIRIDKMLTFSCLMTYIYIYICHTAPLTSRCCILYIYSTNIHTEYFKHAAHSPFFLFKMPFIS